MLSGVNSGMNMLRNVLVLLLLSLIASCRNTYFVESYKPKAVIGLDDTSLLESRFTSLSYEGFILHLEWFTYDNEVINKLPYKLFVVLEPLNDLVLGIEFLDVLVTSSKGYKYEFINGIIPFSLSNNSELKRSSITLEPAFEFDFHGNERIKTEMRLLVKYKDSTHTYTIEHEWHPVRVKMYAPVV